MSAPERPCAACGVPMTPGPGEEPRLFAIRKYCGATCRNRANHQKRTIPDNPRMCQVCGDPIPITGSESRGQYAAKKYCSRQCVADSRRIPGRVKREQPILPEGRTCPTCHKVIAQRDDEKPCNYIRRRFCDRWCASVAGTTRSAAMRGRTSATGRCAWPECAALPTVTVQAGACELRVCGIHAEGYEVAL